MPRFSDSEKWSFDQNSETLDSIQELTLNLEATAGDLARDIAEINGSDEMSKKVEGMIAAMRALYEELSIEWTKAYAKYKQDSVLEGKE